MDKQPLVSIVLPVYNGEEMLPTALDSIVNQSYPNIEVVAVNNSSTDRTLEILEEYAREYPQIKIYTIPFEPYSSGTKRYGYSVAQGEYIGCCDADDRMHYRAVEWLVEVAQEDDYDIIVAPVFEIFNGKIQLINKIKNTSLENVILSSNVAFWAKIIRKSFYLAHEPLNRDFLLEDSIYHFTVVPYAKVGSCNKPVYYYYRWDNVKKSAYPIEKMLGFFDSYLYVLEHLPDVYTTTAFYAAIRWTVRGITYRWVHADRAIKAIKQYWPQIEENSEYFLSKDPSIYDLAMQYAGLPDMPIPNAIYINGFGIGQADSSMQERIHSIEEAAFYDGCQVIILNENTCDFSDNELVSRAFQEENWEFVGAYCALQKIYENGGIYLHQRIRLEAPLNYVRYFPSFFARTSEKTYSDSIFGGMAGNHVLKSILDTYVTGFYPDPFYPLADRIENILVSKYHVPMVMDTGIFKYATVVFAPSVTLYPLNSGFSLQSPLHFCYHDFSEQAANQDYYTMPVSLFQANLARPANNLPALRKKADSFSRYDAHFKNLKKWQRFIILYFMDRNLCKEKAKRNFASHPFIYKVARAIYRFLNR